MSPHDTSDENVAKKSIKKMDKIVTWLLLSGVIASIYGVKKIHDRQKEEAHHTESSDHHDAKSPPPKKRSIVSRIFFGN